MRYNLTKCLYVISIGFSFSSHTYTIRRKLGIVYNDSLFLHGNLLQFKQIREKENRKPGFIDVLVAVIFTTRM